MFNLTNARTSVDKSNTTMVLLVPTSTIASSHPIVKVTFNHFIVPYTEYSILNVCEVHTVNTLHISASRLARPIWLIAPNEMSTS